MATLSISVTHAVADTTSPIGSAAVSREIEIHADSDVNETSQLFAVSGGSDSQLAVGSITVANGYQLTIDNTSDPDSGADLDLSLGTGGSFAGAKFGKVRKGMLFTGWFTAAVYGKSADAAITVRASVKATEYVAP